MDFFILVIFWELFFFVYKDYPCQFQHPGVSDEIKAQIHDTYSSWADLRQILKDRDEQLDQSGHLQRFIRDLDDFEKWLHAKMNEIVNEVRNICIGLIYQKNVNPKLF